METYITTNTYFFVIFFVGTLITLYQLYMFIKVFQCKNWKETEGKIILSEMSTIETPGEVDKSYGIKIRYQYSVNGKNYSSKRVYFGDKLSSSFKFRYRKMLKKYNFGKIVRVYYNPFNNNESVLSQSISIEIISMFAIGILMIAIGLNFLNFTSLLNLFQ